MKNRKLPVGVTESRTEPWYRYSRGQQGQARYFYYGKNSTKARARADAVALANRENEKWTRKIVAARKGRKSKSNRSGVVGVSIKTEKGRLPGTYYYYWWARWPGCGSGIKFSILEHQRDKAFYLAQIARELETQDRVAVEREYLARKKTGKLKALQTRRGQTAPARSKTRKSAEDQAHPRTAARRRGPVRRNRRTTTATGRGKARRRIARG